MSWACSALVAFLWGLLLGKLLSDRRWRVRLWAAVKQAQDECALKQSAGWTWRFDRLRRRQVQVPPVPPPPVPPRRGK